MIIYEPAHPYLEHIQAARCVLLAAKTGFELHATAHELLARTFKRNHIDQTVRTEIAAYLDASRANETAEAGSRTTPRSAPRDKTTSAET